MRWDMNRLDAEKRGLNESWRWAEMRLDEKWKDELRLDKNKKREDYMRRDEIRWNKSMDDTRWQRWI